MTDDNRAAYESDEVVSLYVKLHELQKPESEFLAQYRDLLANGDMLDVGVGAGRTTIHFAPIVRTYTGVDLSEAMIVACRARFGDRPNLSFAVSDVRDLSAFANESFDVVMFSYNGLDYVSHGDRLLASRRCDVLGGPARYCSSPRTTCASSRFCSGRV